MTLTQFKYLLSIVDNKLNITKAAESSNTSQPGISKQIKLLEDELGAFIFARKGKKITALTSFGEEVVWYAKKILQDVDNIRLLSDQISDIDEGVLTLATTSAQARYILPEVIQVFKEDFPKVKLELKLGSSEQIREMVIANEVDLAIENYDQAIKINPNYADAHYNLGIVMQELGDHRKAIVYYEKAIQLRPEYAKAYNNLGVVYQEMGEHLKAINVYKKAITVIPNSIIINGLSDLFKSIKLGNVTKANSKELKELFLFL